MAYDIEISEDAKRSFKKLDKRVAQRIYSKLKDVAGSSDPFQRVKRLTGVSFFSLRVGAYRIILDIKRNKLIIFVIKIGHRADVYG
ncbi:MAG: type II toxin-antitoxin system RelE/ParE family toxin [Candidatus Micrarchaeota archaeon]|nr:type II toxin-antitoxin system RelE/ParE family toxin [Candidatus Micrarchaeota archaeon]MDE1804785.1 type II toxin-antitoxin system RelE/ParE family toxin [Candidatus Micrarchaeota archaeon]